MYLKLTQSMKLLLSALFCLLPFTGAKHLLVEIDGIITEETNGEFMGLVDCQI